MDPRKLANGDRVRIEGANALSANATVQDDSKAELTGIVVGIGDRKGPRGMDTSVRIKLDLNGRQIAARAGEVTRLSTDQTG